MRCATWYHWCFSGFLNCTNGTKSREAPQIYVALRCETKSSEGPTTVGTLKKKYAKAHPETLKKSFGRKVIV